MVHLMSSAILMLGTAVPVAAHWIQELQLYNGTPGWPGCVLRTCRSPKKYQSRCVTDDDLDSWFSGVPMQEQVFAHTLGEKSIALAAFMQKRNEKYKQALNMFWSNNGKGILLDHNRQRTESFDPALAQEFKVLEADIQQEDQVCRADRRLGELHMTVTQQQYINKDGELDTASPPAQGSIAFLKVQIENRCLDCGEAIEKGFYIRIEHSDVDKAHSSKDDKWFNTFEFTSRRDLACGSTGTFDILLSSLPDQSKWPKDIKIALVSACREQLSHVWLTQAKPDPLVEPTWGRLNN